MTPVKIFKPDDFLGTHGLPDIGPFTHRFLAQGDSWFSIGALNGYTTNLLMGTQKWPWDGILMSAGGNDLIDAVQVLPTYGEESALAGQPIPQDLRILLRADEWKAGGTADRYVSDAGWDTFSRHLRALFAELEAMRDSPSSDSKGVPVFVHCYDYLLARPAGAGLNIGPWLYPAVTTYKIPPEDWSGLGVVLIDRLRKLLCSIQMKNMHVVDTTPGTLAPASSPTGASGDWANEIHPTPGGYRKLAKKYGAVVDAVLP